MSIPKRIQDFLFVNKMWGQSLAKNLIWLALGQGTVRLVRMAVIFLVVRVLGPEEYGRFALAYAFVTLFTSMLEGGILTVAAREFAADPDSEKLLPDVIALKVISNTIAAILIIPGMFWITHDHIVRTCIVVLLTQQFILEVGSSIYGATRARGKMEYESALSFLQNILLLVFTVVALRLSTSALTVSFAQLASAILWFVALYLVAVKGGYHFAVRAHWATMKRLGLLCLPLLMGGIATAVYTNIDSVLLGKTGNLVQVGLYSAAVKVVQGILLLPIALATIAVVPAFASLLGSEQHSYGQRWNKWRILLIVSGSFLATALFGGVQPLISIAFGARFLPTIQVVRIISVSIIMTYIYTPYSQALIIFGKQGRLFYCQAAAAIVSVLGNLWAIPRYGMYGAAWTTLATQFMLLILLLSITPRCTPRFSEESGFLHILGGCVCSFLLVAVAVFYGLNPWLNISLAAVLFGGLALFVFRGSVRRKNNITSPTEHA